ncbi:MAG: hypothetical protein JW821_01490 [Deltaproteobacteria bacterium]|nr:hypothetical protein [Deltaproteobacteria bacterium]
MYEVAFEEESVVIRFDRELVDRDCLSRFLDYINLETVRNKSPLWDRKIRARIAAGMPDFPGGAALLNDPVRDV